MHEALNQWDFVYMAYAVGIVGTLGMAAWSWQDMRRAEKKRDAAKQIKAKRA